MTAPHKLDAGALETALGSGRAPPTFDRAGQNEMLERLAARVGGAVVVIER
jgi:hypothetical protein